MGVGLGVGAAGGVGSGAGADEDLEAAVLGLGHLGGPDRVGSLSPRRRLGFLGGESVQCGG